MPEAFPVRGIVEGFYGTPWSHRARCDVLTFVAERGMNAYVYAPKDEPKHRARWRDPYTDDEIAELRALCAHAGSVGIDVGFAISPGLDIDYGDGSDRATLVAKLRPLLDAGIAWFVLALDDIPLTPGLAPRQTALATWLLGALREQRSDARLTFCPTEYLGTRPSPYLSAVGRDLPMEIDVLWTGPTVCSPELRADDAAAWRSALGGRGVVVWDNFPVNDGMMDRSLHLGAYRGRDPQLRGVVDGVLCNPMVQPHASLVGLATACEFLSDPEGYDPDAAWERALVAVGGERARSFAVLARACADGPLAAPETLEVARAVDGLATEVGGPGWQPVAGRLAAELRRARALPDELAGDDALAREVAPWAAAAAREARAGLAALALVQQLHPVATVEAGRGVARGVDAEASTQHAFGVLFGWAEARRNDHVAFGPRFAVHPALVGTDDGRTVLDLGLGVRDGRNAIDALCRLALDLYRLWATTPVAPLQVTVDGEDRDVATDGTFDAGGEVVLVHSGGFTTQAGGETALPFRDARLS